MVKEKLKSALTDAVGYYNDGYSANDAIVKAASDHDLTVDQTDRVVESFNTAKTINYYDKHASDRSGSFDLASKKDVTLALFGDSEPRRKGEKKASVTGTGFDRLGSFYASTPDTTNNRKGTFKEKRASLLDILAATATEKWAHCYSDKTIQDMASDAYSTIKAAEADADLAIRTINEHLISATTKLAEDLTSGGYDIPSKRAGLFKAACPHKAIVRQLESMSGIIKAASTREYERMNVIDTSPVDDMLKLADDMAGYIKAREEYKTKKAEFAAKARKLTAAIASDPSLSEKVASATPSSPADFIHAPTPKKRIKAAGLIQGAPLVQMPSFIDSSAKGPGTPTLDKIKAKREIEAIRDEQRSMLLADLLSSDPILQDADPRQVASIYSSLISSAPRVSLNREVVRSVLRGAVNSIAFSPNDMKVITDVDEGINKAHRLSSLDSSIKDSTL